MPRISTPWDCNGIAPGWILFHSRRYDEAIREVRAAQAPNPDDPWALWFFGFALSISGHFEEAIRALEEAATRLDRNPAVPGVLVDAYARDGRLRRFGF